MKLLTTRTLLALFLALGVAGGCAEKGPAEKVGEKIDKTIDPRGPAEKAGENLDKTAEKVKDKMER